MCLAVSFENLFDFLPCSTTKIEENVTFCTDFACEDVLDCEGPPEEPIFHVPDKSSISIKLWTINNKKLQSYAIKIFFLVS